MPNISLFKEKRNPAIKMVFNKKKVIKPIPSKSLVIHLNKKKLKMIYSNK